MIIVEIIMLTIVVTHSTNITRRRRHHGNNSASRHKRLERTHRSIRNTRNHRSNRNRRINRNHSTTKRSERSKQDSNNEAVTKLTCEGYGQPGGSRRAAQMKGAAISQNFRKLRGVMVSAGKPDPPCVDKRGLTMRGWCVDRRSRSHRRQGSPLSPLRRRVRPRILGGRRFAERTTSMSNCATSGGTKGSTRRRRPMSPRSAPCRWGDLPAEAPTLAIARHAGQVHGLGCRHNEGAPARYMVALRLGIPELSLCWPSGKT